MTYGMLCDILHSTNKLLTGVYHMPRGVKKKPNFEAQIAKIDEKIAKAKNTIAALNKEKAELVAQKEASELVELNAMLKDAGKSPADVIALLK